MNKMQLITIGIIAIIVIAAVSYFAFIGFEPSGSSGGGTLTIADPAPDIEGLEPRTSGPSTFPYVGIVFEAAFEPALKDGELVPQLLESWERLDDLTLVFNIREGVLFHNGEEMTSEDWKYSFEQYAQPPPPPPAPPPPPQFEYCQHVAEIEIIDRYTIKIVTDVPYGAIPDIFNMHAGNFFILPKNASETLGADFQWNPIGTGPFKFAEYVEDQYVRYERFDDYWAGVPNLDEVVVRLIPDPDTLVNALEAGEVDVIARVPELAVPSLLDKPNIEIFTDLIMPGGDFTAFNHRLFPTNDIRFRKAISLAINYDEILPIINPYGRIERKFGFLYTFVASGAAPWAYNPEIEDEFPDYDLDEAKNLLSQMQTMPTIKVWGWDRQEAWVTYIANVMEQDLGLTVDFQLFTGPSAIDALFTRGDEWHIFVMGSPTGHPLFLSTYYHSTRGRMPPSLPDGLPPPPPPGAPPPGAPPPGAPPPGELTSENYAGYVNTQVDEWLDLAEIQISRADQANFYFLAERQAVRDVAYLWNYEASASLAYRSDLVGDVEPYPYGQMIFLVNADNNVFKK